MPKEIVIKVKVPTSEEATEAIKDFVGKLGALEVIVEGKQVPVTEKVAKAIKDVVLGLPAETLTPDEYLQGSKEGKWCAIVGCRNTPTECCPRCGARYCFEHVRHHFHIEQTPAASVKKPAEEKQPEEKPKG